MSISEFVVVAVVLLGGLLLARLVINFLCGLLKLALWSVTIAGIILYALPRFLSP